MYSGLFGITLTLMTLVMPSETGIGPAKESEHVPAFAGAEGFGSIARGGRGGKLLFVTNLNDSGPGSLREAIGQPFPRYVLFRVSGTIALESPLNIEHGLLTIAGQTAPGDGITIRNYPVYVAADDVIIRFIRFRMGDAAQQEGDALGGRHISKLMVDHCSMSWSTDECVSFYANENTTVQWCIISESLRGSVHSKGAHGYGGIWGGRRASFHHNLLAHHDSRNPRLGEQAGRAFALTDLVDLRNNVIYNWGGNSTYGGEGMNVNIVNCYYKPGPATRVYDRIVAIDKNEKEGTEVYNQWGKYFIEGNVVEGSGEATTDNWRFGVMPHFNEKYGKVNERDVRVDAPHNISQNVITETAQSAYESVLVKAGASLVRDAVDQRIVEEVRAGEAKFGKQGIIDSQQDVGGWPFLKNAPQLPDTSADGMPDAWKTKMGLNPLKYEANGHDLHPTYDNLEVYLDELVQEVMQFK